MKTNDG